MELSKKVLQNTLYKASNQTSFEHFINFATSDFLKVQHEVLSNGFVIRLKKRGGVAKYIQNLRMRGVCQSKHRKDSNFLSQIPCLQ